MKAIFWGSSWSSPGDKISGIDAFYGGVGETGYMGTNVEYTGTNGRSARGSYAGPPSDISAAPRSAPATRRSWPSRRDIPNPVANGYYPVYSDQPRGNAGYCAWHSCGTIGGVPVQFAFFFNLNGDSGCDPKDTVGQRIQGLAALANVSGHELSETVTDPRDDGWWDARAENADKCAWTFDGTVKLATTPLEDPGQLEQHRLQRQLRVRPREAASRGTHSASPVRERRALARRGVHSARAHRAEVTGDENEAGPP